MTRPGQLKSYLDLEIVKSQTVFIRYPGKEALYHWRDYQTVYINKMLKNSWLKDGTPVKKINDAWVYLPQ